MGGTVVNPDTGKVYQNATVVECDGCPSDIDKVGYEYHAGQFVPCAPYGFGSGNLAVVCNDDCKVIKDSGLPLSRLFFPKIIAYGLSSLAVTCTKGNTVLTAAEVDGIWTFVVPEYGEWTVSNGDFDVIVNVDTVKIYSVNLGFEQVVNYTMLYDGSLGEEGETGANACLLTPDNIRTVAVNNSTYRNATYFGPKEKFDATHTLLFGHGTNQTSWGASGVEQLPGITETEETVSSNRASFSLGRDGLTITPIERNDSFYVLLSLDNNPGTQWTIGSYAYKSNYLQINWKQGSQSTMTGKLYELGLCKADDFATVCDLAGVSANTISEAIEKTATILNNRRAVFAMTKLCTGDFMVSAVLSETFLSALASSPYKEIVYANKHWARFLAMVA